MDLGSLVINYRRKMGMNTSISEQKKDLDFYGSKLKALFENMNIDYTIFKEEKRKNAAWKFPDEQEELLFDLLSQLTNKDSCASEVIVGKAANVPLNDLLELVDLCLELMKGLGISDGNINEIKTGIFKMLEIPLLEIKQELSGLQQVAEISFSNESDALPMSLHMKYQKYLSGEISKLKRKAALVYLGMNQEYEHNELVNEANALKSTDEFQQHMKVSRDVETILAEEFPDKNLENAKQYYARRKELMEEQKASMIPYIEYMTQQAKIEALCGESDEYNNQIDIINKYLAKNVNLKTKVNKYAELMEQLEEIKQRIIKEQLQEEKIEQPLIIPFKEFEEDLNEEEVLKNNISLFSGMLSYCSEAELRDKMMFILAEQLFGKL